MHGQQNIKISETICEETHFPILIFFKSPVSKRSIKDLTQVCASTYLAFCENPHVLTESVQCHAEGGEQMSG